MVSKQRITVRNISAVDKDVSLVFCILSSTVLTWGQQRERSHMSLTFLPSFVFVAFFVFFPPFVFFFSPLFYSKRRSGAAKNIDKLPLKIQTYEMVEGF